MLTRNYGVSFGTVNMLFEALVFLGCCASICPAFNNFGFMDIIKNRELTWKEENPYNPKWAQMLNMVNTKTEKKYSLYAVKSVKQAKDKERSTHYDIVFWPVTDKQDLPTCRAQFVIPLFGRHRDMTVESYDCDPVTRGKKFITDLTHLNFRGENSLLTLQRNE